MNFSAVILTGGASRRMGRDKAWIEVRGQPLLLRAVATVRRAGAGEVFISGRRGGNYAQADCPVLFDARAGRGPLSGIERALRVMNSPLLLVLAVDLPKMTAAFLRKLVSRCDADTGVVPLLLFSDGAERSSLSPAEGERAGVRGKMRADMDPLHHQRLHPTPHPEPLPFRLAAAKRFGEAGRGEGSGRGKTVTSSGLALPGELEPLVAVYPKRCHALAVEALREDRLAARDFAETFLRAGAVRAFALAAADRVRFANWNSPGDLAVTARSGTIGGRVRRAE